MILLYRTFFPLLALLLCPYYFYRMWRRGGYGKKIRYRLGFWPSLPAVESDKKRIWIQAVSVGEVSSISKILNSLLNHPSIEVVLSGTTSTGLVQIEKKFGKQVLAHGPFPLDWWPFSSMAWRRIQADMIITVDSELWPEHFQQASLRGTPALVINARLSDRTYRRISNSPLAQKLLLPKGLQIFTTSEKQRCRWSELGLAGEFIQVVGNLKIDAAQPRKMNSPTPADLRAEFGFPKEAMVLAGISTWPREEELLIQALLEIRNQGIDGRLLLIPRHAERRNQLEAVLKNAQLPYHLRSSGDQAPDDNWVYLADTTGELPTLILAADLALIGKTLPPNQGGQNPIEPIAIGLPLVSGPNFQNFSQTCNDLLLNNAIRSTGSAKEAKNELITLALSAESRKELSQKAKEWINSQGSPAELTLEKILQILEVPASEN